MAELKKCTRCALPVPREAVVCGHCRTRLAAWNDDWWQASDGMWYPPYAHPDFGKRPLKPPAPKKPMSTRNKVLIGVAVAVGAVWLIAAATMEEPDRYAERACEEFYDLRDADLYTDAELREQIRQIWDEARYSDNADVRVAARSLLSAVTVGSGYSSAVNDMGDACRDL